MKTALALSLLLIGACWMEASAEDQPNVPPPPVSEDEPAANLTGTLKKVRDEGTVTIGYRAASFPFSYVPEGQARPIGYSIDLCSGIVDEIVKAIDNHPTLVAYQLVTPEDRIALLKSGKVDLECGSTTATAEREKEVAFSSVIFVAGTKLMVQRSSPARSYRDLAGKVLVVTAGTTNEAAMRALNEKYKLKINIVSARDHEESYSLVASGKADAFATDDVLLYGLIARHKSGADMMVVGDFLTYEPYGIMYRKDDPQMHDVVTQAFDRMAQDRDLVEFYHKWFLRPTPTGERVDLPISLQLSEALRVLGVDDFQ
jgi:glutamate/aspartate transport system substrate-binding protein